MKITQTNQFKQDIKRQQKRRKNLQKLKDVIEMLVAAKPLPAKNRDRALMGDWIGWRDCHVEPDSVRTVSSLSRMPKIRLRATRWASLKRPW